MYDLIILGGGPAGVAAAVYAARKQLKTLILTSEFGGQSTVSTLIYNWIGTPEVSGVDLAADLKKHALYYKGPYLDIVEGEKVDSVTKSEKTFEIKTESGKNYTTMALLVATGSGRRKLEAENADKFENKGITYCAGFESALQLLAYCKSVTLIHRSKEFKADEITVKKTLENPKFKVILNADIKRVDGEQFVSSLTYADKDTGVEATIPTTGIFVEVGQIPNTDFLKGVVELDAIGKIVVNPLTQTTSIPGIWAAGDATNGIYHQNNIAAGDAVKAIEDAYIWIHKNK
jgi:alkyl hydroperoxide reductase subunit F